MKTLEKLSQTQESIRILLIGNNPIEMSSVLDTIAAVPGRNINTEIAFDTKSILNRLMKFEPTFILIDDNIGREELNRTIELLTHHASTRQVPISVIKNSNYSESIVSADIMDYFLKRTISAEALYNSIKNILKFRRTRQYLSEAYRQRKSLLMRLAH
jgi:DNA-binding NarL/FixJ family response regulator